MFNYFYTKQPLFLLAMAGIVGVGVAVASLLLGSLGSILTGVLAGYFFADILIARLKTHSNLSAVLTFIGMFLTYFLFFLASHALWA